MRKRESERNCKIRLTTKIGKCFDQLSLSVEMLQIKIANIRICTQLIRLASFDRNAEIKTIKIEILHMDEQRQDDSLETTYITSAPIQDVSLKTCWKQWTIEKGGERGSGISMLMARWWWWWWWWCSVREILKIDNTSSLNFTNIKKIRKGTDWNIEIKTIKMKTSIHMENWQYLISDIKKARKRTGQNVVMRSCWVQVKFTFWCWLSKKVDSLNLKDWCNTICLLLFPLFGLMSYQTKLNKYRELSVALY